MGQGVAALLTPPILAQPLQRPTWLLITSHHYWDRLRSLGEWAFPDKALSKVKDVQPGDQAIVYLTQDGGESSIGGLIRFTGPIRKIQPKDFFGTMYPHRMPIEVVKQPVSPVPIRPLVEKLDFITNKQNWGLHFQGHPVRRLPEKDAARLIHALERKP